eukprot:gnl/MRDRNA2_/MRDRNA2_29592_c0_seq1.p1 gnl/MRDRNA2_/MRDRNA2_29592_c0~~gnl/MRDRNA2_/MRDRNA2_29592_c0_seq1.p1  ORF type:complete len:674 (-),score=118.62 gnl/MRDRNA2_/MRDRNA2_29592_c0_seq1:58-2079(-)
MQVQRALTARSPRSATPQAGPAWTSSNGVAATTCPAMSSAPQKGQLQFTASYAALQQTRSPVRVFHKGLQETTWEQLDHFAEMLVAAAKAHQPTDNIASAFLQTVTAMRARDEQQARALEQCQLEKEAYKKSLQEAKESEAQLRRELECRSDDLQELHKRWRELELEQSSLNKLRLEGEMLDECRALQRERDDLQEELNHSQKELQTVKILLAEKEKGMADTGGAPSEPTSEGAVPSTINETVGLPCATDQNYVVNLSNDIAPVDKICTMDLSDMDNLRGFRDCGDSARDDDIVPIHDGIHNNSEQAEVNLDIEHDTGHSNEASIFGANQGDSNVEVAAPQREGVSLEGPDNSSGNCDSPERVEVLVTSALELCSKLTVTSLENQDQLADVDTLESACADRDIVIVRATEARRTAEEAIRRHRPLPTSQHQPLSQQGQQQSQIMTPSYFQQVVPPQYYRTCASTPVLPSPAVQRTPRQTTPSHSPRFAYPQASGAICGAQFTASTPMLSPPTPQRSSSPPAQASVFGGQSPSSMGALCRSLSPTPRALCTARALSPAIPEVRHLLNDSTHFSSSSICRSPQPQVLFPGADKVNPTEARVFQPVERQSSPLCRATTIREHDWHDDGLRRMLSRPGNIGGPVLIESSGQTEAKSPHGGPSSGNPFPECEGSFKLV